MRKAIASASSATRDANTIQQPGLNNWDMGPVQEFPYERALQYAVRWETFNTWNHTQFGSAALNTSSPAFGSHH